MKTLTAILAVALSLASSAYASGNWADQVETDPDSSLCRTHMECHFADAIQDVYRLTIKHTLIDGRLHLTDDQMEHIDLVTADDKDENCTKSECLAVKKVRQAFQFSLKDAMTPGVK